jgi:hypothetical protein
MVKALLSVRIAQQALISMAWMAPGAMNLWSNESYNAARPEFLARERQGCRDRRGDARIV